MAILSRKKAFWLIPIIGVLVGSSSCAVLPGPRLTASVPAAQSSPTPGLRPCASSEFALPESVLVAGEELAGVSEPLYRALELGPQQYGWLSVHLDPIRDAVQYGEPIPLQLTITNGADQPVIFIRPHYAQFLYYSSYPPFHPSFTPPTPHPLTDLGPTSSYPYFPIQLCIDLIPFPGEIRPPEGFSTEREPPLKESFSMLRPGQSCTVEWELVWKGTVPSLPEPIPPGSYTLRVFLRGTDLGPEVPDRPVITILDIGGWVGTSEASNAVTLTVLPPE